ncbi:DNA (cytosine-5-)-methyltransferase [Chromobacterium sp. ATCC 53434]|uniref:DNA cytosine methyltransferase n=1 Tax=Chromobacterium sp. (strain ATCC 53434 / SC 14030) TaxID=2059672 RepID=UPI000C790936|nr:DNA cytosine methyltransferase [Chromobacterium sp. ATCC 53434]AUH51282.1 DNA (cytosine-5-)-methyltransferase [Chromobacterium sp. ATCC 53434]
MDATPDGRVNLVSDAQPCTQGSGQDYVKLKPASLSPLQCVDLFAGAGGFSLAARRAKIRVVAAVELNKHACDTYRTNLIDRCDKPEERPRLYPENILALSPEDVRVVNFADNSHCDIVLGGPPCQGFSVHRIKDAGVGDPRNALILRYFEYVQSLNPKVFLMENVPGLLWPRHRNFLDAFLQQSDNAGYRILGPLRLDARNYGLPQRRVRVFVLGIRHDVTFDESVWPPAPTHGDARAREQTPHLKEWVTAADVFAKPDLVDDVNNCHMNHSAELIEVFRTTPINGGSRRDSKRVLPCHEGHDGHSDVYGRINPNEPGPTMTTACINPSKGRFVHPTAHHGITVRQAARFQTFPDDFIFKGGLMAAGAQIGNAVPVDLGEILLRAVSLGLGVNPDA